jgi:hypothetical protein
MGQLQKLSLQNGSVDWQIEYTASPTNLYELNFNIFMTVRMDALETSVSTSLDSIQVLFEYLGKTKNSLN